MEGLVASSAPGLGLLRDKCSSDVCPESRACTGDRHNEMSILAADVWFNSFPDSIVFLPCSTPASLGPVRKSGITSSCHKHLSQAPVTLLHEPLWAPIP